MSLSRISLGTGPYGTEVEKLFGKDSVQRKPGAVLHLPEVEKAIREIGLNYVRAGANLVLPDTFGARQAPDRATYDALVRKQVGISKQVIEAAGDEGYLATLSYIPFGPHGECYSTDALQNHGDTVSFHAHQIAAAADFGLTALFETVARKGEVVALAEAAAKINQQIVIGLVVRNSGHLLDGSHVNDVIDSSVSHGVKGYVVNCSSLEGTAKVLDGLGNRTKHIVGVYPNASADLSAALESTQIVGPENLTADAREIVRLIGGLPNAEFATVCCGHGPESIKILAQIRQQTQRTLGDGVGLNVQV